MKTNKQTNEKKICNEKSKTKIKEKPSKTVIVHTPREPKIPVSLKSHA